MSVYIVMLGLPGAGKGTQAELVSDGMGLRHISTGAIFRENIKNKSELGQQVEEILKRGELVPDDLTNALIEDALRDPSNETGIIFDGYPRTTGQAQALDQMLSKMDREIRCAPYIMVPEEVLVRRLTGRWTCRANGHIFHEEFNPPKEAGKCDFDGSELYQRDDDREETVLRRIEVFKEQTQPLIDYYGDQGKLLEVNGDQYIEWVTEALMHGIRTWGAQ